VGPLLAGFLAGSTPIPLIAPYLVILLFLPVPLILLVKSTDVIPKTRNARLVRPIRLPRSIWAAFSVAAATVLGTNLCMCIYGSFGSNIAGAVGWNTEVQRGLLVSLVLFMVAAVQPLNRNLEPKVSMFIGLGSCAVGWALVTLAAVLAEVPVMVVGSMLVGAGAGLCLMGSAALVGQISPIDRRAEIYSSYLIVAFTALGATALISGPLIGLVSITAVVMAASVACMVLMAYVIFGSRRWLSFAR
jgi:hypothetical protein